MKPFILSLILAASLSAKVVTKSCPICGQCEPDVMQISTYNWLGDEYLLCFVCDSNGIVFRNQVGDDTIKWVPKQVEVKPFTGLKTVTLDTGSAPCRPIGPKKRKCEATDTTIVRLLFEINERLEAIKKRIGDND